ncbi:MAG: hypothetical protein M3066_09095 [Actinomycetota bacterium]|nr:hypothetical protein [Actinomycetota bacterium]
MPEDVTQPDPDNIPPYEGRTTGRSDDGTGDALTRTVARQMAETKTGRPGATASPAKESPVRAEEVGGGTGGAGEQTATSTDASTPLGVGTSTTRRGEDVVGDDGEQDRHATGTQGRTQRPVGESTPRESTGIDPQESDGPTMPASGSSS